MTQSLFATLQHCNIGAKFKLNPPYRHLINSKSSWPLLIKPMRVLSLHLFLQFHTHDFFSCKWHHLQKSTRLTFLASTVDSQGFDCICKQATNHADFSTLQIGDQSVHWLKSYDQKVQLCPKPLFGHNFITSGPIDPKFWVWKNLHVPRLVC